MTFVFVVTYQSVHYGEEVYDYKHFMLNPVSVIGVFSTEKKADDFIKWYSQQEADDFYGDDDNIEDDDLDSKERWKSELEDHCSIVKLELDKNKQRGEEDDN